MNRFIIHAKKAVCLNQMRQIHLAATAYAMDSKDFYPTMDPPDDAFHGATNRIVKKSFRIFKEYKVPKETFVSPNYQDEDIFLQSWGDGDVPGSGPSRRAGYSILFGQKGIMKQMRMRNLNDEKRWKSATRSDKETDNFFLADLNEMNKSNWVSAAHPGWGDEENLVHINHPSYQNNPFRFGAIGGHITKNDGSTLWVEITDMKKWHSHAILSGEKWGWW